MRNLALEKITKEFGNGEFTIYDSETDYESEETTARFEEFIGKSASIYLSTIVGIICTCDLEETEDEEIIETNDMHHFDVFDKWCKLPRYVLERKGVMDFMARLGKLVNIDYVFVYMPQ